MDIVGADAHIRPLEQACIRAHVGMRPYGLFRFFFTLCLCGYGILPQSPSATAPSPREPRGALFLLPQEPVEDFLLGFLIAEAEGH